MHSTGIWTSGLIGALSLALSFAAAEDYPKPKIRISSAVHDFGTVAEGTVVRHEFDVMNVGTADLILQRVVAPCGCTATTVLNEAIPPQGTGKVRVEFDTNGFSGEKVKAARIYSNDIDDPTVMVSLKGNVESEVLVEPRRIVFGDVVRGTSPTQKVVIKIAEGSSLKLSGARSYSDSIVVNELSKSGKKGEYEVSLSPNAPLGELRDRVVVSLAGGKIGSVNIPIFGAVQGMVRARPSSVSFGVIEGAKPITRTVKVENLGPRPMSITKVVSNDPAVTAVSKPVKDGKVFQVEITVSPEKVKRDLRALVEISTSAENEQSISLSVLGILPPKSNVS